MIQSGQRLDEYISAFVPELVAPGDEEVQSLIQIKIIVPKNTQDLYKKLRGKREIRLWSSSRYRTHKSDP